MHTTRLVRTSLAAALGAATLLTAAPVQAQTATPRPLQQSTLNACKQLGQTMVTSRLAVLSTLAARVASSKDLSAAHRTQLTSLLDSDRSGLTALDSTIQGDTTLSKCSSDVRLIVTQFRVYVLVVPQVHLVIAADVLSTVDATFARLEGPLGTAIGNDTGLDPGQRQRATEALADLASAVSAAAGALKGQADAALDLTPAGYPGTTATLKGIRASLESARDDLQKARRDFDTIADILDLH